MLFSRGLTWSLCHIIGDALEHCELLAQDESDCDKEWCSNLESSSQPRPFMWRSMGQCDKGLWDDDRLLVVLLHQYCSRVGDAGLGQ
ncbi:hypothetical protein LIER_26709 [Lithospermum erythrorhizon]|uniref:Uncharacterized protein n=1 Tax=Lithospermum erythrorhizon TaxID=34254 RepID=A0AAV3RD03_LITER